MKKATFAGFLALAALVIVPVAHATTNALPVNSLKVVAEKGSVKHATGSNWHEEHHHHHHHRHEWWGKNKAVSTSNYAAPQK